MPRDKYGYYKWLDANKTLRYYFDRFTNDPKWDGLVCGHRGQESTGNGYITLHPWAQLCDHCTKSLFERETKFEENEFHEFDDKAVIAEIRKLRPNSPWLEYVK